MQPETLALTSLAVSGTIGVMDKFLPDLAHVRQRSDPTTVMNVRMGEVAVGAWALGMGAYLAWVVKSKHPMALAMSGLALVVLVYETALHSTTALEGEG